jgi:hypothetical protein
MGKVVGWIIVVLFGLMVAPAVSDGAMVAAFLMATTAVLALPVAKARESLARINVAGGKRAALVGVCGLVALATLGVELQNNPKYAKKKNASTNVEVSTTKTDDNESDVEKEARVKASMKIFYRAVLAEGRSCDEANKKVIDALQDGSVYEAYGAAKNGAAICNHNWSKIRSIDGPDELNSEQDERVEKAKESCGNAYLFRSTSLEDLMSALDGGMKPSQVESYKEKAELAQSGIMLCVANLMSAAHSVGMKPDELK